MGKKTGEKRNFVISILLGIYTKQYDKTKEHLLLKELMLVHCQGFTARCLTWYIYQVRHVVV
jgi:hypothetical protein